MATLDRVAEAIEASLPACRENWWTTHGSRHEIGLVNRRVEMRDSAGGDGFRRCSTVRSGWRRSRLSGASRTRGLV